MGKRVMTGTGSFLGGTCLDPLRTPRSVSVKLSFVVCGLVKEVMAKRLSRTNLLQYQELLDFVKTNKIVLTGKTTLVDQKRVAKICHFHKFSRDWA